MSVVISKEGDQPAKIVVKRGDDKWELTEKELNKLPADIRPHVERMLGRGPLGILADAETAPGTPESRLEKRFDEMNRRIDKLLQSMEDTGDGRHQPAEKPSEK
jgi:hypothetical protein